MCVSPVCLQNILAGTISNTGIPESEEENDSQASMDRNRTQSDFDLSLASKDDDTEEEEKQKLPKESEEVLRKLEWTVRYHISLALYMQRRYVEAVEVSILVVNYSLLSIIMMYMVST